MYEYNAYLITGGTGFIGKQIVKNLLPKNKKIYIASRQNKHSDNPLIEYIQWDVEQKIFQKSINENNVCVIHLAGTNVAEKRWSEKQKNIILQSRTLSAQFLYELIRDNKIKASYVVSASAIGYYGAQNKTCIESDTASNDFLGLTCQAWEKSVEQMRNLSITVGILRIGLVLGKDGGAIPAFLNTLQYGIAGIPASGKQLYSWIHIQDIARLFVYLSEKQNNTIFNAVAPQICTAKELLMYLGKYYRNDKFIAVSVPAFVLKLALGEFSIEILKSASVSSKKIIDDGFDFLYKNVEGAVRQIVTEIKNAV